MYASKFIYIYIRYIYKYIYFPSIKVHSTLGSSISSCKLHVVHIILGALACVCQAYVNTPVGTTLAHAQTSPSGGKTTYVWVKDLTPPTMTLGKLITGRSKNDGARVNLFSVEDVSGQVIAYEVATQIYLRFQAQTNFCLISP